VDKASGENISFRNSAIENFISMTGSGAGATIDGTSYFIGNHALVEEKNICSPAVEATLQQLEREGKTVIILCNEYLPLGIIAVADEVRKESGSVVNKLREQGIKKIIILTGDNTESARAIAQTANIDEWYAELLPHQKTERIQTLKREGNTIAMVGDGMNDAPALAASTVGIAMGGSGTDIALETSDVVLISDDIAQLPHIINLSRKTLSIIKQNIAIALLTKILFIGLGILGSASLWMAILADDGVTLVVILNGLRILYMRSR
jgi:Cd2+/Zn2+-exporting ATPase